MNKMTRVFLILICVLLIAWIPFVVSSPVMLPEVQDGIQFSDESYGDIGSLFFGKAYAEGEVEVEAVPQNEGLDPAPAEWELPLDDFVIPPQGAESNYSEEGYEDSTIRVTLEEIEEEQVRWVIARIQLSSPSQLRTAFSKKAATVSSMAKKNHAIIAINGDYLYNDPKKTTYEVRMGKEIRKDGNGLKDMLLIDDKGDFHIFRNSQGVFEKQKIKNREQWVYIYEGNVVNAFTFGPGLVIDGVVQNMEERDYGYNRNGREPRAAIGQTGELSYVFVLAAATDRDGKTGVNHQQLADMMGKIGCQQAFNLDGGGSAEIVFHDEIYRASPGGKERPQSDMIYVCTLVPEGQ